MKTSKKKTINVLNPEAKLEIIFAFLDVTDGMKSHDFLAHMGGTQERADECAAIRDELLRIYGDIWIASK